MKIISVVPSLTELLFDLGLDAHIIGVTRFCIHPAEKTRKVTKVGGTKSLKIDRIIDLKPDLIIANKEENAQADIEELQKHCNVWVTDIFTLSDALDMVSELGIKTHTTDQAQALITQIKAEFKKLSAQVTPSQKKVAYLIWDEPIMLAGRNTFIHHMIEELGWTNMIKEPDSRYPMMESKQLKELQPDYILLSSEPYPFKEKHLPKFKSEFPNSKIILVDGEMFSWYGSRMKLAPSYFIDLLTEASSVS
ncbi:ABC transporter substrate-binding protein [bacterium SCSIO 12643]|nr:ABC transporter substrate-binding protein [bacterium SCSIO 12643]